MKIAIIHITDIHFTIKSNYQTKIHTICQAIISATKGIQNVYFIISGDIAFSGKSEEYEVAKKFLSLIKTLMLQENKGMKIKYIIVPGNHDCNIIDFDTQLRKNAISNMNYQTMGNDRSVIEECLKVQAPFWEFYSYYNSIPEDKLFYTITDEIQNKKISFYCINTAWMSEIDEKVGSVFFPVQHYESFERIESEKSFGIWHHPYNWFNPSTVENNKKEFELFTESISSTHFFGHEHEQSNYNVENRNSGSKVNLLSGDLFNEDKKPKISGFQILTTEINSIKGNLIKFNLSNNLYHSTEKEIFFSKERTKKFKLNDDFITGIESIKIPLTIEGRKTIQLSEIFVFPDLESESSISKSFDSYISSKRLLDRDLRSSILNGEGQIGKSALLAQLYVNLYERGYSPILLVGDDFKEPSLDKIIKKAFKKQYEIEVDFDKFYQSPKENLALLIDDFQNSILNSFTSKQLLEEATLKFGKIIIVVDSASSFLPKIKSEFNDFKSYSIKPLGYKRRNDLIERYHYLKTDTFRSHEQERLSIIKNSFDNVQSILGDKFMPSYPVFILGILQALEYKPSNLNETSFGYCYQALILYSLNNAGVTIEEIDTYFNFLTELAYEFIRNETETISSQELLGFYYKYQNKYMAPPYEKIVAKIQKSKILNETDGEIRFGYNYILYYLSAKRISDVLHTSEGKKIINELFNKVHIERNASILVFVTHHSKDVSYIEQSILNSMMILENNSAITLEKRDPFYNSLQSFANELINNVLETNRNPKAQREADLIEQDKEERQKEINKEKNGESVKEITDVMIPFHQAFRSIEIVGQIVKNRKGSLEKLQLLQMIKEVYTTGFRTITYMIELLETSKDEIIQAITEETESSHSRYEVESKINKFIQFNNLYICLGVFIKLMHSVGTKELKTIYTEVANELNTPASKIVSFSINSYYGTISEKELTSLANEFKDNQVALSLLRSRVKSYVYNKDLDFKTKQKFADILKMTLDASKANRQKVIQ